VATVCLDEPAASGEKLAGEQGSYGRRKPDGCRQHRNDYDALLAEPISEKTRSRHELSVVEAVEALRPVEHERGQSAFAIDSADRATRACLGRQPQA
jgi:hypothetical protein